LGFRRADSKQIDLAVTRIATSAAVAAIVLAALSPALAQPISDPLALRLNGVVQTYNGLLEPAGPIAFGEAVDDTGHFVPVQVENGVCYTFVAVSEPADSDLDLHVYAEGVELAFDIGVDPSPVVHWCNHVFERVSLEIRMYRGAGRFAFQVFTSTDEQAVSGDVLWAELNALSAQFAEGFTPASAPILGELALAASVEHQVMLSGGHCYVAVATAEPTVHDIDLFLLNASGEQVDSDQEPDARPVLRYCVPADEGADFAVRVSMAAGYGRYGLRLFSD